MTNGYDKFKIAEELWKIAMGIGYYENAIKVCLDLCNLFPEEKSALNNFLKGSGAIRGEDGIILQGISKRLIKEQKTQAIITKAKLKLKELKEPNNLVAVVESLLSVIEDKI